MNTKAAEQGTHSDRDHENVVKALLMLLQERFEEMGQDAAHGQTMFDLGILTDMGQKVDAMARDPYSAMYQASSDVNRSIKTFVDRLLHEYFQSKKSELESVLKLDTHDNSLYYYIVMKEDKPEQRDSFFRFFDYYDALPLSEQFPVHFQFTPRDVVSRLEHVEPVRL